jgi:hypothetical protein
MPKEKGSKKTGGRVAGVPNKSTALGKTILEDFFFKDGGLKNLLVEIAGMEYEKDRVNAKIKLLEFVMPKQKEVDLKGDGALALLQLSFDGTTGVKPIISESEFDDD